MPTDAVIPIFFARIAVEPAASENTQCHSGGDLCHKLHQARARPGNKSRHCHRGKTAFRDDEWKLVQLLAVALTIISADEADGLLCGSTPQAASIIKPPCLAHWPDLSGLPGKLETHSFDILHMEDRARRGFTAGASVSCDFLAGDDLNDTPVHRAVKFTASKMSKLLTDDWISHV
jgi:hypothetical protein